MTVIETLASIGMAVGPPLIYADQAYSIVKKKDSSGFSHDVCGVVIIANIIRIFFWLGARFELPLLVQSLLLILSQLLLLAICLHYAPSPFLPADHDHEGQEEYAPLSPLPPSTLERGHSRQESDSDYLSQPPSFHHLPHDQRQRARGLKGLYGALKRGERPFSFWQWEGYGAYLEFLAGLIVVLGVLQVVLARWQWYIDALGFVALTIESTLPIPQFITNYKHRSCYGFRSSTLAGWFFGDAFKTVYFFLRASPVQFKVTSILTLCWDSAVLVQRVIYGAKPPAGTNTSSGGSGAPAPALQDERRGLASGIAADGES